MCDAPDVKTVAPAPPPKAPPVLEQLAPKSAVEGGEERKRKRSGLSRYKIAARPQSQTNKLGGISKKTGANM